MADISNFVSALTQGNEDLLRVGGAAQLSTVDSGTVAMPGDTDRVFQMAANATFASGGYGREATNHSAPTTNHIIFGFWFRWASVAPTTDQLFWDTNDSLISATTDGVRMVLESDGDIRLEQADGTDIATATTPVSADTWYRFEVRILPNESTGEVQVWYAELGGSSSDLFGGNQTGKDTGTYLNNQYGNFRGNDADGDTTFFGPAYCMINSTAASDRLDSDFEIIGPYQDTAISGTTPDNGNTLDAGDWANVNEIPFSDTAALATYTGNPDLGGIHYDGGTRSGPSGDSRVDNDAAIKAWKGIFRGQRGNGASSGGDHRFYVGDDGGTWTSGFDSVALVLTSSDANYYFCTDVSTNMPTSSDNFSLGFGTSIARDIMCREMAAFVLHVPAAVIADDEDAWFFTPGSHQPVIEPDDIVSY